MSRDFFPTVKSKKHVIVIIDSEAMSVLTKAAFSEHRSFSNYVSRALERDYEEKKKLKIV